MSGPMGSLASWVQALEPDGERWCVGSSTVCVHTASGAVYELDSDGRVSGGSKQIRDGKLVGAVYRDGGPICPGCVVVGLRMEIAVDGCGVLTSTVMKIEEVLG